MSFSDETLMAYADDELAEPDRGEVERAVRGDPAVAARVARHRALRSDVFAAFAPVVDEPMPPRLVAAALPGKVADLSAVRAARAGVAHPAMAMAMVAARAARAAAYHDQRRDWSWRNWAGLAAALAVGVLLGSLLGDGVALGGGGIGASGGAARVGAATPAAAANTGDNIADNAADNIANNAAGNTAGNAADNIANYAAAAGTPTVASAGGAVVAKGPLANALSRQMAGAGGGSIDIGVSFFDKEGALCRSFAMSESAGLACRGGDQWRLVVLAPAADHGAGAGRPADAMPAAVLDAIDTRIAGSPLDAREEYAARLRGWKR